MSFIPITIQPKPVLLRRGDLLMNFMWRIMLILCLSAAYRAVAFVGPATPPLANFDKRTGAIVPGKPCL